MSERKWVLAVVWAVFGMLCLWVFLSGFVSGNVVTMVVGVVVAFVYASLYLTSYVRSDHIVKRAFEEGRTARQCPKCKEYEVDEDGYCQRCRQNTLPPL